jgi:hypothetical protein
MVGGKEHHPGKDITELLNMIDNLAPHTNVCKSLGMGKSAMP